MNIFIMIVVVLFGIIIGSFLNVCIVRLPKEESIVYPASHCVSCNHELKFIDLIPVLSFIFLRGRCRYCDKKISVRYILIELLTGVIAGLTFYWYGFSVDFFRVFVLEIILLVVTCVDLEYQIIPDQLVLAGISVGIILIIYDLFVSPIYRTWYSPLLGGIVVSSILFIFSKIGQKIYKIEDVIGLGDVKLFIAIGMILGLEKVLIAFLVAIYLGGVYGIGIMLIDKKNSKKLIPFAPFISLGSIVSVYFGYDLVYWYIDKFIR